MRPVKNLTTGVFLWTANGLLPMIYSAPETLGEVTHG